MLDHVSVTSQPPSQMQLRHGLHGLIPCSGLASFTLRTAGIDQRTSRKQKHRTHKPPHVVNAADAHTDVVEHLHVGEPTARGRREAHCVLVDHHGEHTVSARFDMKWKHMLVATMTHSRPTERPTWCKTVAVECVLLQQDTDAREDKGRERERRYSHAAPALDSMIAATGGAPGPLGKSDASTPGTARLLQCAEGAVNACVHQMYLISLSLNPALALWRVVTWLAGGHWRDTDDESGALVLLCAEQEALQVLDAHFELEVVRVRARGWRMGDLEACRKAESGTGARGAKSLAADLNALLQAATGNPGTRGRNTHTFDLEGHKVRVVVWEDVEPRFCCGAPTEPAWQRKDEETQMAMPPREVSATGVLTDDVQQQNIDLVIVARQDGDVVLGVRLWLALWGGTAVGEVVAVDLAHAGDSVVCELDALGLMDVLRGIFVAGGWVERTKRTVEEAEAAESKMPSGMIGIFDRATSAPDSEVDQFQFFLCSAVREIVGWQHETYYISICATPWQTPWQMSVTRLSNAMNARPRHLPAVTAIDILVQRLSKNIAGMHNCLCRCSSDLEVFAYKVLDDLREKNLINKHPFSFTVGRKQNGKRY
ncbi:hypothetical protein GGX14DRAFT_397521 [Mycena pura]|uniref:Uncharacterized protein n=1 Tax=Mycena pura TaxID=153505 RepID=A0AAD6Y7M4_9AGAR|nr:hypothetical protein GGX14DRAFT_397521 [Mycena pura]